MQIIPVATAHHTAVAKLNRVAFGSNAEDKLVSRLREEGLMLVEQVASPSSAGPAVTSRINQAGHTTARAPDQIFLPRHFASEGPSTYAQRLLIGARTSTFHV